MQTDIRNHPGTRMFIFRIAGNGLSNNSCTVQWRLQKIKNSNLVLHVQGKCNLLHTWSMEIWLVDHAKPQTANRKPQFWSATGSCDCDCGLQGSKLQCKSKWLWNSPVETHRPLHWLALKIGQWEVVLLNVSPVWFLHFVIPFGSKRWLVSLRTTASGIWGRF